MKLLIVWPIHATLKYVPYFNHKKQIALFALN